MNHRRFVAYHSREWDALVESGWRTHTVDELPDGTRIACMVWEPPSYRRRM